MPLSSNHREGMGGPPFDALKPRPAPAIKFLCSYGGKILPRHPDGKLRYVGGETRVLAVDRAISFSDSLKSLVMAGVRWKKPAAVPYSKKHAVIVESDQQV